VNERRTFVVTVRSANGLTVEDVVRRDIEALPDLDGLSDWIARRLEQDASGSPPTPQEEEA
jgi:hypothetical protein